MKNRTTAGTLRTNQRSVKERQTAYWPAENVEARVKRKETCRYIYLQARLQRWTGKPGPETQPGRYIHQRYRARVVIVPAGTATQLRC